MPLSVDDVASLITTAAMYGKPKEKALILLMRYSGLSIVDAVTLPLSAIKEGNLTLRRAKSDELVMVPLHSMAIEALEQIERASEEHYFWTGAGLPLTTTKYWRKRLNLVAREAGVANFRPHRLRDTFAVELLLTGVPIQEVSTLLGHSSVRTTEKYYAPWNLARRDRLVEIVRESHACDRLSELVNKRMLETNMGAVAAAPINSLAPVSVMQGSSLPEKSVA